MATRLYFSGADAPAVSPAFGAWDDATGAVRRKLLSAKSAGGSLASDLLAEAGIALARQYVSEPLAAQSISGSIKCYIRAFNNDLADNVTSRISVRVYSGDGATLRGDLFSGVESLGTGGAFDGRGFQNLAWANGDTVENAVAAQAGDRLVIEIGANNPAGDACFLSFGAPSSASDLPENETETGALVPWIEFSADLTFQTVAAGAPNLPLLGVG